MRLLAATILILGAAGASPAGPGPFHVSPNGNDAGPGTSAQPFRTLERARDAVRAAGPDALRRILVKPGEYPAVALVLDERDSGLTIEGSGDELPQLLGGLPLEGWEAEAGGLWSAPLPAACSGSTIRMFMADGRLSPRARLPETGSFEHRSEFTVKWMSSTGGGWERKPTAEELTSLKPRPEDLPAGLSLKNAEVTVFHMWDESCVGVSARDAASGTLTLSSPCGHPPGAFGVRNYVVWNTREGLTRPGQWFHDRERSRIVYRPLDGQDVKSLKAWVPVTQSVLTLRGTKDAPACKITLRRLALSVTNTPLAAGGFAAARYRGAVDLENTEDCVLEALEVSRVGGTGIKASGIARRIHVSGNTVEHCGAGGIYVSGNGSVVSANHVRRIGVFFPSAIGIHTGGRENRECRVLRNEVHDCPYTGINYGGGGHRIEGNDIYDCMKVLRDGAAIYLFGARDCLVRRNLARDIQDTGGYGSSAFYLDEGSRDCIVEENLSWRVPRPFHGHMASQNTLRNNVFVVAGDARLTFPKSSQFNLEKNIIYAFGAIRIENIDAVSTWSKNILYSGGNRIEGLPMNAYAAGTPGAGIRGDTLNADPQFKDLEKMNLSFKAESPAPTLGIFPLDLTDIGRPRTPPPPPPPDDGDQ